MRFISVMGVVLLMAVHAGAVSYSWVDDNGTYNFTEDYSRVPVKYRNKIRLDSGTNSSNVPESASKNPGKAGPPTTTEQSRVSEKSGEFSQAAKQKYDGKTLDEWRAELKQKEDELAKIKQQLDQRNTALNGIVDERRRLTREYNDMVAEYDTKYAAYRELVAAGIRAGLPTETK
jgi:hypothetical protein